MNYDNVAPEGESLLKYFLCCADADFGATRRIDGEGLVIFLNVSVLNICGDKHNLLTSSETNK